MSVFLLVTHFFRVYSDILARWFWGSMLHKLIARLNYFPSILRMTLREGPNRQWYNRIDETVILGALPFKSQTKELVEREKVRAVVSYNESYELKFFTNSTEEWAKHGVVHHWFSTVDFQPPALPSIWSGVRVIEACKDRGECVYVHCKAGKGRSTVVVACYVMKSYKLRPSEALEYVHQRRPQISMNARQKKTISEFYDQLNAKRD